LISSIQFSDCNPGIEFSIPGSVSGLGLQISRHFGISNGLNYAHVESKSELYGVTVTVKIHITIHSKE